VGCSPALYPAVYRAFARMISTEHSACLATASEVLPSKKRTAVVRKN
jgi:hypothetical protein